MRKSTTKRALIMSALAMLLSISMLVGTTFAWFTDSVSSSNNIIKSGNLDVELEYWNGNKWVDVKEASDILTNELWEPGVTEVAYLRVANAGSLAFKYQLGINIINESAGVNKDGKSFLLSDYIQFGVVEGVNGKTDAYETREAAVADVTDAKKISAGYTKASTMESGDVLYLALVVYMPTTVGNEANHDGTNVPQIDLGINIFATQNNVEADGFDSDYDVAAPIISNPVSRPERPAGGSSSATDDLLLNGLDDVTVMLPGELIDELPEEVEELSLAVSAAVINNVDNTITFHYIEVVDQDGDVIDLESLDTGIKITVTIPAQTMFAPGETVMIYHDGEYIATAIVKEDTTIVYEVEHLCEVTVGTTKAPVVDAEDTNIIKISNVAELMGFAQSVNAGTSYAGKTVVLTADIDLNNVSWTPIGRIGKTSTDFTYAFKGTFDGQNHTISNLNVSNEGWGGLFGIAHSATISNLKISGATITGNRMAGAVVGQLYGSIDNCHVENVTINVTPNAVGESYDNGDKVGGIVGWIGDNGNNRTLTNCTVTNVTLSGYRDIGGIAGYVASSTTVANNTVTNYTITADQTVNFYGEKDINAGAIIGRVNGTITESDNKALGEESKVVATYYKNGVILKTEGENVTLYLVPETYTNSTVNVPEGVTAIGNYAFAYNANVETVVLASTVRDLGRGFDSSSVKKVVLNEGLTTISSRAFRSTTALEEVVFSSTVTEIADNAFQKSAIKEIVIPASVKTIGETAFGASLIEKVTFEGNTAIQGYAFRGCTKLREVVLEGDDVTFIASTLNGRNSCWFCNGESNNPNTSNITFTVRSDEIKERVLTAMGAERNNTPVIVDDGFVKVETVEALAEALANATAGAKINANGLTLNPTGSLDDTVKIPAGVTIKDANFAASSQCYLVTNGTGDAVVFENCTFDGPGFGMFVIAGTDQDGAAMVFEDCTFKGQIAPNFVQNTNGSATFNNCTFTVGSDNIGLVNCMGGTHTFNNCTFDYTGGSTFGSNQYVRWNAVNSYSERYATAVILNGCTFKNCGTQRFGSNSTLTIK